MADLSTFRWVAFDAVGTLLRAVPSVPTVYHRIGSRYGSSLSAHKVRRRFRECYESAVRATAGTTTSDSRERDFWRQLVADVLDDVTDPQACFGELYDWYSQPQAWRCFDDVAQTLQQLRQRGLRLVIASNFDSRLDRVCEGKEELQPIERRVISSQVGWRKPSRQFYRALCDACQCAPCDVLMVGDDWIGDVMGARAAGLSAIHLDRKSCLSDGCIRQLTELLDGFSGQYR